MTPPKQFLIDEKGEKIAIVISIKEYEELLEELEDAEAIREFQEAKASGEVGVPFDEAIARIERERTVSELRPHNSACRRKTAPQIEFSRI